MSFAVHDVVHLYRVSTWTASSCILFVQVMMLTSQHASNTEHMFSCDPVKWPFMGQNIIYWIDSQTNVSHLIAFTAFLSKQNKVD